MITKLYIAIDGKWKALPVYNRVEFDERLDEQLDSGTVQTINWNNTAYEDYSLYRVVTTDVDGESREESYFGFDTVEQRSKDYYIHTIELVEPTRIVMGIPIDGCKVTQPIEGEKKSLYDVVFDLNSGFLAKAKLISTDKPDYTFLEYASDMVEKMKEIPSPEFHWECGTLLWECLCDVGNVINCIPRIRFIGTSTSRLFIDFVPVNDITAEYEL